MCHYRRRHRCLYITITKEGPSYCLIPDAPLERLTVWHKVSTCFKQKKGKTYCLVQQVDRKGEKGNLYQGWHDTHQHPLHMGRPVTDAGEEIMHGDCDPCICPDECQHCQNESNEDAPGTLLNCKLVHLLHHIKHDLNGDSLCPSKCMCHNHMTQASAMLDGLGCSFENKMTRGRGHSK